MNYYVIGDTHFNHHEMQEYCNRPANFESKIYNGLMSLHDDDVLIHLGDICIGRDIEMHEKYIAPLTCRKVLVRGNHDKRSNTWYMHHGWDFVCDTMTINMFGATILFSHRPMLLNGAYNLNIHAHLHNIGHRDGEYLLVKHDMQRLYACEDFDYRPMSVKYFVEDWNKYNKILEEKYNTINEHNEMSIMWS